MRLLLGIFPQLDVVRLLFEHGHALPDPDGIFSGGGRQVRHVDLRPGGDIPYGSLEALIGEALRYGAIRVRERMTRSAR